MLPAFMSSNLPEVSLSAELLFRRAKEEAERKARQERQVKVEASQAKKKVEEAKKKVTHPA